MKAAPWVVIGLASGFLVGLAWGRSTRSSLGRHVTTDVDGAVVTVQVDAGAAARSGLLQLLGR